MLLIVEIGMLIYGLVALIGGRFSIGKNRYVLGWRARVLGGICMGPLPFAFCVGLGWGMFAMAYGGVLPNQFVLAGVEFAILIVFVILLTVLGNKFYASQQREAYAGAEQPAFFPAEPANPGNYFSEVEDPNNPYRPPTIGPR